jgi:5-methyltetrahydrofolate--homocysteine methyltransferase
MIFDSYGKYIFYDGAMGTMLQKYGLKSGEMPDFMNITAPEAVENVHRMYIEAGSDIVCTNTFGSNALNLEGTAYSPTEIITAAVAIARRACDSAAATPPCVALDIGPTGRILEPAGELEPERAYELFKEMAIAGEKAGADFAAIETMSDVEELKVAMSAVKENTSLPILTTMTFEKSGRTFMGCTPESFVEAAESLGAAAIGLNCSLEPLQMLETAKLIARVTRLPLIIKPNAGLPDSTSGEYKTGAQEFAAQMKPYAEIGARIIGGCCGTTPEYIRELKKAFNQGETG